MTSMSKPKFFDSPFFVKEDENLHLLPGAPEEVVREFEAWMKAFEDASRDDDLDDPPGGSKKRKDKRKKG